MKFNIIIFLMFISLTLLGQVTFEKGYIIDNDGKKTECYIKELGWSKNPNSFKYKLQENDQTQTGTLADFQEFAINEGRKFKRFNVQIEHSRLSTNYLSTSKDPDFKNETIFLDYIIEGETSLLMYKNADFTKFFYMKGGQNPLQLVFIKYFGKNGEIAENNTFKQQLWDNLSCESINKTELSSIEYSAGQLSKIFIKYHECKGASFIDYLKFRSKGKLNITIKPGLMYSQSRTSLTFDPDAQYSKQRSSPAYKIGIEIEYILPFNRNKWSFFVEPSFQYSKYKTTETTDINALSKNLNSPYTYRSIQVPIGIRHYIYIFKKSSVFINAGLTFDFDLNEKIIMYHNDGDILGESELGTFGFGFVGLGVHANKKIGVELRYNARNSFIHRTLRGSQLNLIQSSFAFSFIYKIKS